MKNLLRLLAFLKPFRWQITLSLGLGCMMIASNIGLLSVAAYLIASAAIVPFLILLTLPTYIVRLMGVIRPATRYTERLVSHNITFRILATIRTWVYQRLEPLAPAYLLMYRSGDLLTRLVTDVDELQNIYLRILAPFFVALVICMLTFGLFTIFSLKLAWVALFLLIGTGIGVPLVPLFLMRGLGKQQVEKRAEQKAHIVDGIQGMPDLLLYGNGENYCSELDRYEKDLNKIRKKIATIFAIQEALNDLLTNLALISILILAIPMVNDKIINGVYLGFLCLLMLASFEAIQPLAPAIQMLGHSLAAGARLFEITDARATVVDPNNPIKLPDTQTLQNSENSYGLTFKDVSFKYQVDEPEVVQHITLNIQPGQRIALVGSSGSGKSTLARLALRYWDVTDGIITLNGENIQKYGLEDLRSLFGVVTQDTYLFNNTLRNNLLLARPDASQEQLKQVIEQVQLTRLVQQLPRGLDTLIGEQGMKLSGGERQRLAIARALLKNAPIFILDEITANVDPVTERALFNMLAQLLGKRTTLLITHRLIAMEQMDEIILLEQGNIRERGTHEQLLAKNGLYRQLWDIQNSFLPAA